MDIESIVVIIRGVERLGIIVIAALSIYWGARLFLDGVVSMQKAEIEAGGWVFRLHKVGPGVFFALFGMITLVISVQSQLILGDISKTDKVTKPTPLRIAYSTSTGLNTFRKIAKATELVRKSQNSIPNNSAISTASALLDISRRELIVLYFGRDVFRECPKGGISQKFNDECKELSEWFTVQ